MLREYFVQYLKTSRDVSDVTIRKYLSAIDVIAQLLIKYSHTEVDLFEAKTIEQLEDAKKFIISNQEFLTKDKTGNRMYSVAFNHFYKFACLGEISTKQEIEKLDIVLPPPEKIAASTTNRWQRNQIIITQVIQSANYSCEYDSSHKTFTSNKTKANYVEGHHIIPMEKQDQFNVSLDVYANIISLCPTCHRLLHYGTKDEKLCVLEKIFNERNSRLHSSGIDIGIKELVEIAR